MVFLGLLIFLFLVVQPADVGLPSPYEQTRAYEQLRTAEDENVSRRDS
jgi:hypothetical protein